MNDHAGQFVLAMDIGGTHTRMGLVDIEGELSRYRRFPTSDWAIGQPMENLIGLIGSYLQDQAEGRVRALSLGFPSAVDKTRRILISTPAIPALDGIHVAERLEKQFSLPVFTDRDVVMLLMHAARALSIPQEGITLGFFIGTGIGNVIYLSGQVFNGAHGIAGELGHIPLPGQDDPCGCGGRGCAELYAAGRALAAIRDRYFPGEAMENLFTVHGVSEPVTHYLETLSQVLATEVIILDPDCVLLGGGVIQMKGFPVNELIMKIKSRLRSQEIAEQIRWLTAPDSQRAGVIGAGLYAFKHLPKEGNI